MKSSRFSLAARLRSSTNCSSSTFNVMSEELEQCGALKILDELLQLLGHDVERGREFADFRSAGQVHSLREIATRNGMARLSENLQRVSNAAGCKNTDADA